MCFDVFQGSAESSLGVELELQLVDAESMALTNAADDVLAMLPRSRLGVIKPEFYRSCVEINSDVCADVDAVQRDLEGKIAELDRVARGLGIRLAWGGTHPFSHWRDQEILQTPRYKELAERYRETLCRQVTFGLHVHVGVPSGDIAAHVCDGLREYVPALLALSANSPFWCGRATGLLSHRTEIMATSPVSGLPPTLGNWANYEAMVERLIRCGIIKTSKELWWDVRPNPALGTVEVRVCDMPSDLPTTLGLVALIQCLIRRISRSDGPYGAEGECYSLILNQNRWRAARHGLDAVLVNPRTCCTQTARQLLDELIPQLQGIAAELRCERWLALAHHLTHQPIGAERQLAVFKESGSLSEVSRYQIDCAGKGWASLPPNHRVGLGASPATSILSN